MAEFLETRIENLENLVSPSVSSKKKRKKKGSKIRKATFLDNFEDGDADNEKKGKSFCKNHFTCGFTMYEYTTLRALAKQSKQKKGKHFDKKNRSKK